jgi:hypothetical protein
VSRLHPFEHALGTLAGEWFPAIQEDATAAGSDLTDRGAFARLGSVQDRLTQLTGKAGAEATEAYLQLLYAAYRYWQAGAHTVTLSRAQLEPVLDRDPPVFRIPHDACYLQLPERWIWSRVSQDTPWEPLDGLFLLSGLAGREVLVVGILGLRPDREGLSQVTASAALADLAAAGGAAPRPRFAAGLEGGAAAGLRSVNSVADLLVLASLALAAHSGLGS